MPDHFNTLITYTSSIFLINVFELVTQAELSMICQAGITVATIAKIIHDIRQNRRNNDQQ